MEKSSYGLDQLQKKSYDMVPQSWVLHYIRMYKIPDQVEKTRQTWRLELSEGGQKVKIQSGTFQADAHHCY